jgi:regulator of protease activity HflC (stomatin/prohibitin superfamily)
MPAAPLAPALFLIVALAAALAGAARGASPLSAALVAWCAWSALLALGWCALPASPRPRLRRRLRQAALLALGLLAALALALVFCPLPFAPAPAPAAPAAHPAALVPALVLAAFAGFFLQTYAGLRAASVAASAAVAWRPALAAAVLRATTLAAAMLAALLVAESRFGFHLHLPAAWLLSAVVAGWILETLLRIAARSFQPARHARLLPPPGGSWLLLPFLPAPLRPLWLRPPASDAPTLALADLWFIPTLRRLLLPLFAAAAALLWLTTTLHEVPHGSLGLETRLGRATAAPLAPGLHFTWPAPFAAVRVLPTERLQSVVLGAAADTGKPILWERDHYVDEEARLVGGGEELLTVSVPIFYHIRDPLAYARHTGDAARLVRDLADRILQIETTRLPAFAIMTSERETLAATLHARLQTELDARRTGLAVAFVALRDVHPPVAVGPAYQDVVSALEDRETHRHEGERLRAEALPRVAAEAAKLRTEADAVLLTRTAQAEGQAARFLAQQAAYAAQPEIFRIRHAYARYDEGMRQAKKLVLSEHFRGRLPATLDVRRTLNPDFAPPLTPIVPALIPTPVADARLDAFDRAIDGYLNAGRGAIPAVDLRPANPDHLLDPAGGEALR